jgi:hypothetical protein
MSRGYVKKTEVIPAAPPQTKRLTEFKSAPGDASKNCNDELAACRGGQL